MTLQVLDVGDRVVHRGTGRDGVVTHVEMLPGMERYCVEWAFHLHRQNMSRAGWSGSELTRSGGDLQIGDLVTVTGTCVSAQCSDDHYALEGEFGVIVDDYEDDVYMVHCQGEVAAIQARPDQLTRITRQEALA